MCWVSQFLILYLYNPTASKARYIETPTIVEPALPDPEPAVVDEQAPEETYYEEQWESLRTTTSMRS